MSTTKTAPDCCQFCGAGLDIKLGGKPAKGVLGDWARFTCGTFWFVGDAENERREIQEPRCATAERERMTRERDEAKRKRDDQTKEIYAYVQSIHELKAEREQLLARVKRLEEAGDMLQAAVVGVEGMTHWEWLASAHEADLNWHKAKEAKP